MFDVWSVVRWWDEWQLRILVLGSLGLQWFLMVAAPMRKYSIPPFLRTCIWLAYVSSDALAIYALATLFNRHAKATTSSSCGGIASNASILEVLWAPVLLIHLGGQEELTAYAIEDNEMWTRHTVTLVSQVAIALYAFYKSWPSSSEWKLLASAILLFFIGVASFSEKPWALNRASINRLASVSARIQGTEKKPSKWLSWLRGFMEDLMFSSEFFTKSRDMQQATTGEGGAVVLTQVDKVYMILADMSLSATAEELVLRKRANKAEDVLRPLGVNAMRDFSRWLRGAFGFIYTRANVAVQPAYLAYHVLVVPTLHIAALTLFATSDKRGFTSADVKITYILLCFTAALDVLAVFIRQLVYLLMSKTVQPLCATLPGYNLLHEVARGGTDEEIGWLAAMWRRWKARYFSCKAGGNNKLFEDTVMPLITLELQDPSKGRRDLASYRIFNVPRPSEEEVKVDYSAEVIWLGPDKSLCSEQKRPPNSDERQQHEDRLQRSSSQVPSQKAIDDTEEIRIMVSPGAGSSSSASSTATEQLQNADKCGPAAATARWYQPPRRVTRQELQEGAAPAGKKCSRTNWVLNERLQKACGPEIRRTLQGSFDRSVLVWHIATDLCSRMESSQPGGASSSDNLQPSSDVEEEMMWEERNKAAVAISNYMSHLLNSRPDMLLTGSRRHLVTEATLEMKIILKEIGMPNRTSDIIISHIIDKGISKESSFIQIPQACSLAKELLGIPMKKRASLMYKVWLGMLCYSASMCRGYLHAKILGEGGEFLSLIWLLLCLQNNKTLADNLQVLDDDDGTTSACK